VSTDIDPTIAVCVEAADELRHLLDRLEDWLRHCDSATYDDLTHFFNAPGNGRLAVEGLIGLLGNHSHHLGQLLKEVGQ
jgi:hypothetical protein